jgi:predicted DNA-binding transcriptional regulator AlpA
MADISDEEKWAKARAIADYEEGMQEAYREHKHIQNLDSRFRHAGAADVIRMFESHTNEKGETLSQFEFEALCERWCAVFGFLPPFGPQDETPATEPDPLPADDTMLPIKEVIRLTGLSKSTIKRRVNDPANGFPKPIPLSLRRIGWRAGEVKAWIAGIEGARSTRQR